MAACNEPGVGSADSDDVYHRLVGDACIKLHNFMKRATAEAPVFRITCFIASVVQLRDVIPHVEQQLQLSTSGW